VWPWGGPDFAIEPSDGAASPRAAAGSYGEPIKPVEVTVLDWFAKNARWVTLLLAAQATFTVAALWPVVPGHLLAAWYVLVLLHGFLRRKLCQRYQADPAANPTAWIHRFIVVTGTNGLLWGGFGVVFASFATTEYRLMILVILTCIAAQSSISTPAVLPRIFLAFVLPALLPIAVYMLLGTRVQQMAAIAVTVAGVLLCRFRHQHYLLLRQQASLKAEQQRLHSELQMERHKEAELLKIKTMLIEVAGHDLMQPVHGMRPLIQKLRLSPSAAALEELSTELQHGLDAFKRSLTTILDTVRLDTDSYIPETFDLPIQSILDRVVAENLSKADQEGLALSCRKSSAWVRTDPVLAYGIISNLVYNAIGHSARGRVLMGTRRHGAYVTVEIWDSGVGIPESALSEVFRDSYQVHRVQPAAGTGMGLALVRRMAELLGSTVSVRSAHGRGSRFSLRLLAVRPQPPTTGWMGQEECLQQKTVVLVDSDATRLERTCNLLTGWGCVTRPIIMAETPLQREAGAHEPADVLIATMSQKTVVSDADRVELLHHQHRPAHSLLVLDEDSDMRAVKTLRARGFKIFFQPMPPWRLRMILRRLLGTA
jgi:signal transduction histidine kinase